MLRRHCSQSSGRPTQNMSSLIVYQKWSKNRLVLAHVEGFHGRSVRFEKILLILAQKISGNVLDKPHEHSYDSCQRICPIWPHFFSAKDAANQRQQYERPERHRVEWVDRDGEPGASNLVGPVQRSTGFPAHQATNSWRELVACGGARSRFRRMKPPFSCS